MLKIQNLKRPTKKSGFKLESGRRTKMRGLTVVNDNTHPVWVDKWTRPRKKK